MGVGVIRGSLNWTTEWSYRIPFGLQWIWPLPLMIATYLAPESPWWLVRQGRTPDAHFALKRLNSKSTSDQDIENYLAMIKHTQDIEARQYEGSSF